MRKTAVERRGTLLVRPVPGSWRAVCRCWASAYCQLIVHFQCLQTPGIMDTFDQAALQVDVQEEQDLAGAVQSSQFLWILGGLALLLLVLGAHQTSELRSEQICDVNSLFLLQVFCAYCCRSAKGIQSCCWVLRARVKQPCFCNCEMATRTMEL